MPSCGARRPSRAGTRRRSRRRRSSAASSGAAPAWSLSSGGARRVAASSRSATSSAAGRPRRSRASGVRVQARADAGGRLRQRSQGAPRQAPRPIAAWLERTGGGRDEDAALLAHHYAQAANPEDADLAWADEPEELERLRVRAAGLAPARRRARDQRATTSTRASPICSVRSSSASRTNARSSGARSARASALKFDGERFWEAMKRALKLTDDPEVQADILADLASRRRSAPGMWPAASRHRGGRGLDSAGARAGPAGQHGVCACSDRPRATGIRRRSMPLREKGARSPSSWATSPCAPSPGARVPRPPSPQRDYEQAFDWALTTGRPAARDRRPRPPDRDLRGADPVLRADRALPGGAATRRGACRALRGGSPRITASTRSRSSSR